MEPSIKVKENKEKDQQSANDGKKKLIIQKKIKRFAVNYESAKDKVIEKLDKFNLNYNSNGNSLRTKQNKERFTTNTEENNKLNNSNKIVLNLNKESKKGDRVAQKEQDVKINSNIFFTKQQTKEDIEKEKSIKISKKIKKSTTKKCMASETPLLDLYTLKNRDKETLLDFQSEISDPSQAWQVDITFVVDYSPKLSTYYKSYAKIINEILVDAENYFHSCVQGIIPEATIDECISVGLIKFNKETNTFFSTNKLFSYLELKDQFFKHINENGIVSKIDTKNETILQVILDGIVTLDRDINSNKFVVYLVAPIQEEVVIEENTLVEIRSKDLKHNMIFFESNSNCNFLKCLSNIITVDPIYLED